MCATDLSAYRRVHVGTADRDNGTNIWTTGHSESIIASAAYSLWRHKKRNVVVFHAVKVIFVILRKLVLTDNVTQYFVCRNHGILNENTLLPLPGIS